MKETGRRWEEERREKARSALFFGSPASRDRTHDLGSIHSCTDNLQPDVGALFDGQLRARAAVSIPAMALTTALSGAGCSHSRLDL